MTQFFLRAVGYLKPDAGPGHRPVFLRVKPRCEFVSVDISHTSRIAEKRVSAAGLSNVTLHHTDIFGDELPFGMFDRGFCFVLEHLRKPEEAIRRVMKMVKPGGTVTAIEGDHGSVCFHPESEKALMAIRCQVLLQERAGGDACIGRKLYPLLVSSGLTDVMVSPRLVYADGGRPDLATGFTEKTFIAMIQGIRDPAIAAGLMSAKDFDEGISDLIRSAQKDGTFSYTFYKGRGINP